MYQVQGGRVDFILPVEHPSRDAEMAIINSYIGLQYMVAVTAP